MIKPLVIGLLGLISFHAYSSEIKRVITLSPHTTEIAYAAGLGNKIIAVSEHSDYPEAALSKEKVADYKGINIEKILALHPDLVITWPAGNSQRALDKLKQMGVNIFYSHTQKIEDIADNIEQLSQFADDPQIGKSQADAFRASLAKLRKRYANKTPISYFYQLSEQPIITIAQDSWPSEVFTLCGGENVFAQSSAQYPQVGKEQVVVAQPQVIFNSRHAVNNLHMWDTWVQIPAVKNHHIWTLNADWINRPTPRTLQAINQVCQFFDQVRQNN